MDYFKKTFQKQSCQRCKVEYGVMDLHRIHHCHRCGMPVCTKCSPSKIKLFFGNDGKIKDQTKPQRVCNQCLQDHEFCQAYIQKNEIKWNTKSKTYFCWYGYVQNTNYLESQKLLRISTRQLNDISLYQICLEKAQTNQVFKNDFESIKKDVKSGRTDACTFNYSVREFIASVQYKADTKEIRKSIQSLLEAAIMYNPLLGYCQVKYLFKLLSEGMNYVAGFLLCFCDEEGAFELITHLFDHILPDRFFQGGSKGTALIGFQAEQHFLKQIIQSKFSQQYFESITSFVDYYAAQFLLTLLIQPLNASCLITTWNEMFRTNSFIAIDKTFLYALEKNEQLIHEGQNIPGTVDMIPKYTEYTSLIQCLNLPESYFKKIERRIYLEQFFAQGSRQWVTEDKMVVFRLKKITNFNEQEIKMIHSEFKQYCLDAHKLQQEKDKQEHLIKQNERKTKKIAQHTDEVEENLTESDEEHQINELEASQLKSIREFKYGINKQCFVQLIKQFHLNYSDAPQKTMMLFDEKRYSDIFDIFDDNLSGLLDFREFLTCFSVLLRGSFTQKLELFYTAFGSKQHKYLTQVEFQTLLDTLVGSLILQFCEEQFFQEVINYLQYITKSQEFMTRTKIQFKNLEFISYADVMGITIDEFVLKISQRQKQEIMANRRGTCMAISQSLGEFNKQQQLIIAQESEETQLQQQIDNDCI